MMEMNAGTQKKAPMVRRNLLPVVGDIGLQFPIFLIYPRQRAKNLPCDVGLRTAQRAAGQQILHRPIVEHAQDVAPLAEAAAKMGDQHLSDRGFIANQLHQLIDAILLQ